MAFTTTQWAKAYVQKYGVSLIKIAPESKKALDHDEWPQHPFQSVPEIEQFYDLNPNYGLAAYLGASGLCSLNIENVDAAREQLAKFSIDLDQWADEYPTIVGDPAKMRITFSVPIGMSLKPKLCAYNGRAIFDLRAGDQYDLLPPSIHPNTHEPYEWRTKPNGDFPQIPEELLILWQHWENRTSTPKAEKAAAIAERKIKALPPKVDYDWITEPLPPERKITMLEAWTQQGIATRFAAEAYKTARYHSMGRWFVWDGKIWRQQADVLHDVSQYCTTAALDAREYHKRSDSSKADRVLNEMQKTQFAVGVERLARSNPSLRVADEHLDTDPMVLNTPEGWINLRNDAMYPPQQFPMLTKVTSVAPDFEQDIEPWKVFLVQVTDCDEEQMRYLQKLCGYCLTGCTHEESLYFLFGPGGNGKTVFINVLREIMGDYAVTAPMSTFLESQAQGHPTDLASLHGARLVISSEPGSNKRWNLERVKILTGGEGSISARFMRMDFFSFRPKCKLLIAGNHKPHANAVDEALKRRIHMIPFTVQIQDVDKDLSDKLREFYPGILAWMIRGTQMWLEEGLRKAEVVAQMTRRYLENEDVIGQWLDEYCEKNKGAFTKTRDLTESFNGFLLTQGSRCVSAKHMNSLLDSKGFMAGRHWNGQAQDRGFFGIRIVRDATPPGNSPSKPAWYQDKPDNQDLPGDGE